MSKKQVFNPYLPLDVYIPDGEPHVFGDRVYVYGSHDKEGGESFCILDYEVWSAPVEDLTDWRCEGTSYRASQDPGYSKVYRAMYAPDVVRGNDGRYYLYYAMSGGTFTGPFHVAVSDTPAGPFAYYGEVRNPDGSPFLKKITFDPAVINDEGVIRLYYGWSLSVDPEKIREGRGTPEFEKKLKEVQMRMFEKSEQEVEDGGVMGAYTVLLADDMLTVTTDPVRIVPGQFDADGTSFEGHAFFEASSIRKIGDVYYFIYSSQFLHELCYATSAYPDRDFVFRGTLVSNGDIGIAGRPFEDPLAVTGNDHGSLAYINGQWYIFYHRHTHKTTYSRQGCAEEIEMLPDGSFVQAQMTSCGLNGGPLRAQGVYPSPIACNLTNGHMPHIHGGEADEELPYITDDGRDRFITDIEDGTLIGYKYFAFSAGQTRLTVTVRGEASGIFEICLDEDKAGEVHMTACEEWTDLSLILQTEGTHALYLKYYGSGKPQLLQIAFSEI